MLINNLPISERSINALLANGIDKSEQLTSASINDLMKSRKIGSHVHSELVSFISCNYPSSVTLKEIHQKVKMIAFSKGYSYVKVGVAIVESPNTFYTEFTIYIKGLDLIVGRNVDWCIHELQKKMKITEIVNVKI